MRLPPMSTTGSSPFFDPEIPARLIVNADDFGISEPINEGIAEAHCKGIVTAASLMATGRAFDHAVDLCRRYPMLDVGVHLTLVAEKPLLKHSSSLMGKEGYFPADIRMLLMHLLRRQIQLPEIKAEWSAQIQRILDCGIGVTHLDSHQHLHVLPGILEVTADLARHYHIPFIRMPMEDRMVASPISAHGLVRTAGAMALRASCRIAAHLSRRMASGPQSPRFLGFYEGGRLNLNRLERILKALKPGRVYELMCHPGFRPEDFDIRRWNYHHEIELQALISPSTRSLAAALKIRLCRFTDLSDALPAFKHHPVLRPDGK